MVAPQTLPKHDSKQLVKTVTLLGLLLLSGPSREQGCRPEQHQGPGTCCLHAGLHITSHASSPAFAPAQACIAPDMPDALPYGMQA